MADAPTWRLPIREALVAMTAKTLDGDTFLRSVMHHPTWLVSGRNRSDGQSELGVLTTEKGRILEVYSDAEALEAMEGVHGNEFTGTILQLEGHELFLRLAEMEIDRVNLNPGQEPKISYRNEQVELLSAWAKQARVELAVLESQRVHDPFGALASYDNYHLIYQVDGTNSSIVLAPDPQGRALGALFTSWDTADAFRTRLQDEAAGTLEIVRVAASEAFPLMKRLDLNGIVFNPWSHLPARALRADILDEILPKVSAAGHA